MAYLYGQTLMCPYKDPEKERARQKARNRFGPIKEATAWADSQIKMLKDMGISHSIEEWSVLRSELRRSKLNDPTRMALIRPPPI